MDIQLIILFIAVCITALVLVNRFMVKEDKLIKMAEKNFFYHVLAKMSSSKYDGYNESTEEKKAMEDYLSKPSEHDKHPIGGYFRLRDSLKDTLSSCGNFHNYNLKFNMGEVGVGVCVMLLFALVITLGVLMF